MLAKSDIHKSRALCTQVLKLSNFFGNYIAKWLELIASMNERNKYIKMKGRLGCKLQCQHVVSQELVSESPSQAYLLHFQELLQFPHLHFNSNLVFYNWHRSTLILCDYIEFTKDWPLSKFGFSYVHTFCMFHKSQGQIADTGIFSTIWLAYRSNASFSDKLNNWALIKQVNQLTIDCQTQVLLVCKYVP